MDILPPLVPLGLAPVRPPDHPARSNGARRARTTPDPTPDPEADGMVSSIPDRLAGVETLDGSSSGADGRST
jgi:hypothetical protein